MTTFEILTFVSTISPCLLVAFTIYYAIYTHKLASQSKKQTRQMILVSKVAFHRELSERVYLPIMKWLDPLRDVNSMFSVLDGPASKEERNIRDKNWNNIKQNLPYLVYQMDRIYEEHIKKIDNLFMDYKKIHRNFRDKLNSLIVKVICPSRHAGTIKLYSRDHADLITYICSEELMEKLLTNLKENNGKIEWYIRDDTQMITSDSNANIKPFDYKEFKLKVEEVNERIKSDTEISSWFGLLKEITKEAKELIDKLEAEISKDEKAIEAELFK